VKQFLPHLKTWLEAHDHPFEFTTEASLNLSDDENLMCLLRDANFFGVFVGIESPDTETLIQMKKKQNTRRSIPDSIHRIYAHGLFVIAGFIVGFDSEKGSIAEPMIELIEEAVIPVAMVGLLYALAETQLGRRLAKEGRLHVGHDSYKQGDGDHCTAGLNFDTQRPRTDILRDYKAVLERIYSPEAFAGRLRRLSDLLDRSNSRRRPPKGDIKFRSGSAEHFDKIVSRLPEAREIFQETLKYCMSTNPRAVRLIFSMMAIYLHLGPFSRLVIAEIDRRIAAEDLLPPVLAVTDQARVAATAVDVMLGTKPATLSVQVPTEYEAI
jgi:hypothetical protein